MRTPAIDDMAGFRRRFRVTPAHRWVRSEVEDDFHRMEVVIRHDGTRATEIEAYTHRAPWNTCPSAVEVLKNTFTGVALNAFAQRGEKRSNCTHLHDLAVLGAAHAGDAEPLVYDVLVSDPQTNRRHCELWRDGRALLAWVEENGRMIDPPEIAGLSLIDMSSWIAALAPEQREPARILRWSSMIAHGRTIPLSEQSDAMRMPMGNCYTFQPHVRTGAARIGVTRDFSTGQHQPLDERGAA